MADRKHKAITEANAAIEMAYEETPEPYRKFITIIHNRKNVGSKDQPDWVWVPSAYLTVAGRIRWAQDEHKQAGEKLSIQTEPVGYPDGTHGMMACINSTLYGKYIDSASANLAADRGVDKTNPWENASTSAIGRALGLMGYGIYGGGVASADEVLDAQSRNGERATPDMTRPPASRHSGGEKPPTEKQLNFIRALAGQHGWTPEVAEAEIARLNTAQEASELIETMRSESVGSDRGRL